MKSLVLSALALGGALVCAPAHAQWEFHAAAGMRQAETRELNRNGDRLVHERGSLPGIEVGAARVFGDWKLGASGEIYGGRLDYDGRTQAGAAFATDTGTTQSRISIEVARRLSDALSLVGALEWDHWRRDIEGRGAVLGLRERYDAWRLLGGAQVRLGQWPLGSASLRGLLVLSAPERMQVRFEQDVFDTATLDTSNGVGARLALGLSRIAGSGLDVEANYEWLRVARSDDAPLRRNGVVAGSVAQPEHVRSGFGIKATYRF
ncbi:hypothetical protein [Noviherbaspirillum pedocola]|uniref:Outer membrane protein beta-barrel domain-containing protein n=1 Tax=Noviherbaspirillum pedocola TaxID=2801341 RepID=A0A934SQX0_9BURK|nr:hypothetical protein [Noviherbaspirillum pedocola]MBK4735091.1 hypothetical protein [Noviherbaspirillum pedocola]